MARLIILIAVAAIALILWHKISKAKGDEKKKLVFWSIIGGVVAVLGILAVTGHLNVITAAIAGLVALLFLAVPPMFTNTWNASIDRIPTTVKPA